MKTKILCFTLTWLLVVHAGKTWACPFCTAVAQTLRHEMKQMDAVAIAIRVMADSESVSTFEIQRVIKGEQFITKGQKVQINYFGRDEVGETFLVLGIDPPDLLWSSPLQLSEQAVEYVDQITKLPEEDGVERLKFYLRFISETDPVLARDVYDEFASASFADMKHLKDFYDRAWLVESVKDVDIPPDRRRLYLVMLGVCGKPEDAADLEHMLRSDDPNQRSGLDALISCYISLRGAEALKLVNELYLSNKESTYADTYSAIMALRFHGTEGGIVDRQSVAESLKLMLDRPELADLVIPDLARWEDWTVISKLANLFRNADDKSNWVRVPVINYLRACPLPEAADVIEELKEIDPVAFRRATQFFPVPQPADSESSYRSKTNSVLQLASDRASQNFSHKSTASIAADPGWYAISNGPIKGRVNPLNLISVLTSTCSTLGLSMWLVITGAGRGSLVSLLVSLCSRRSMNPKDNLN